MSRAGFTLLELLVAVVIFLIFLGAVYGAYTAAGAAMTRTEAQADLYQSGRVLLGQLNRELSCAYQASTATVSALTGEDTEGDAAVVQADVLTVVTSGHALDSSSPAGDLCQVRYRMQDPATAEPPGLYLEETRHPELEPADATPVGRLLSPRVVGFNCRYLAAGAEDWAADWVDQATLPVAVRVELTLRGGDADAPPLVLVSTANLALATASEGGTDALP